MKRPTPQPTKLTYRLEAIHFEDGWSIWPKRCDCGTGRMMWHVHKNVRKGREPKGESEATHYTYKAALNTVAHYIDQDRMLHAFAAAIRKHSTNP